MHELACLGSKRRPRKRIGVLTFRFNIEEQIPNVNKERAGVGSVSCTSPCVLEMFAMHWWVRTWLIPQPISSDRLMLRVLDPQIRCVWTVASLSFPQIPIYSSAAPPRPVSVTDPVGEYARWCEIRSTHWYESGSNGLSSLVWGWVGGGGDGAF
jgi:hypothetical protein